MTASQSVTEPVPGMVGGQVGDAGDDLVEEPERKRRRRLLLMLFLMLALVLLFALTIWYLLFRQPIPIPVLPGETVMPTYTTSLYGVQRPLGVAVAPDGSRLFVAETSGSRIARVLDSGGREIGQMQPPLSTGADHVPVYMAADPMTGEIYVTDRLQGAIYIYDATGTYQRSFQPAEPHQGWQPLGLAFDAAGNLYVGDVSGNPQVVRVFDRGGHETRSMGQTAGMSFPNGVAVDSAGNTYVADGNNGRLLVFDPQGTLVGQIGRGVGEGNLALPRGVAIDAQGRVYVGDATGQGVFVYRVAQPGQQRLDYLGYFGGEGIADGKFQFPGGVAVDGRGRVYVADSGNDRVQLWSY